MNNKRSLYKCSKNKYKRQEFRSPVIITHRTYSASRPTAHKICINFIRFDDSLLSTSKYAIKTNIELTNVPPAIVIASEYIITLSINLRCACSQFKCLRNYLYHPPSFIVIITVNPNKRGRGS